MALEHSPLHPVPPPRDGWADALEEARELEGTTFEDRYRILEAACQAVFEILEHHPDREAILSYQEPLPPASLEAIARARLAGAP